MEIPGLDLDIYFGDAETPPPDWRKVLPPEKDDSDELTPEERQSVIAILGFDPAKYDKETEEE